MSSDRNDIAQALWYVAPGRAEVREEVLLPPSTGSVCVRALHGALSRGTESLIFSGRVPKSEFDRMRAPFMAGAFPFPVKYGYSVVGRIETGPRELRGRAVFALHPHQTRLIIPVSAAIPLPESLTPIRAVLAANMETALNAVWDASPENGDRIAIVGAGVVGALVGYLCRRTIPDVDVTLIDVNPAREQIARALGLNFAMPDAAPTECDLVVHASATASGLGDRTQSRARRSNCAGAELVRRGRRPGSARRRVSQPAPALDLQPSRQGRALAPRYLDPPCTPGSSPWLHG